MDLIRLTIRLHDGGTTARYATTAQRVDDIEARYLATIPGAVFALRSVTEKNISRARAFWLYQAQALDWLGGEIRRSGRQGPSHNVKRC